MTLSLSNSTKAILGLSCLALSACGGGETTTDSVSSYASLSDTTRTTALNLTAAGLTTNTTTGVVTTSSGSGSFTPSSGSITVAQNGETFTDTNGPNSSGVYEDSDGSTFVATTNLNTSGYDYLDIGNLNYTSGGMTYDVAVVYGVETAVNDMPDNSDSATATYNGSAVATAIAASGDSYGLSDGSSTVSVSFAGGGDVDVTLTGFTVVDALGAATTAPFDTIHIDNMTISGNEFSGGDITTTNGGTLVVFAGSFANDDAQGAFFAQDGIIPDEVGGVFISDGSNGFISGTFIGD